MPWVEPPFKLQAIEGFMGTPHITVWARPLLRQPIRDAARASGCYLEEGWGWWTRKMVIAGTLDRVNRFVAIAWQNPDIRKSLQIFSEGYDDDQH